MAKSNEITDATQQNQGNKEMYIVLRANTVIDGKLHKKGEKLPITEELKKKLKPFGYTF